MCSLRLRSNLACISQLITRSTASSSPQPLALCSNTIVVHCGHAAGLFTLHKAWLSSLASAVESKYANMDLEGGTTSTAANQPSGPDAGEDGANLLAIPESALFAPPADPTVDGFPLAISASKTPQTITEGSASVLFAGPDAVFYNKVQILNRDMSICAIRAYDAMRRETDGSEADVKQQRRTTRKAWLRLKNAGYTVPDSIREWLDADATSAESELPALPGLRVLEALSASGLRSVRYAKEIDGIDTLVVNDFDEAAVESIKVNMRYNGLQAPLAADIHATPVKFSGDTPANPIPRCIVPSHEDAVALMYKHKDHAMTTGSTPDAPIKRSTLPFDVVDLDPYGTASPFLDTAVQAVVDGGLLCVTCTDMAVLAGNHMDSCHGKYGSMPVKGHYPHEQALRIVLAAIETAAIRHRRVITPLLSLAMDFYVRIFVKVESSARQSTIAPTRLGYHFQCAGCDAYWVWPMGKWPGSGAEAHTPAIDRSVRKDRGLKVAAASTSTNLLEQRVFDSKRHADKPGVHVHANFAPPLGCMCPHCDRPMHMGGPIWLDPIHNPAFVDKVMSIAEANFGTDGYGSAGATDAPECFYDLHARARPRPAHDAGSNNIDTVAMSRRRLLGLLRGVRDELLDVPLHFDLPSLVSRLHLRVMPAEYILQAIRNAGYRVSGVHSTKTALKTDAPPGFIWDVLREWEKLPDHAVAAKYRENPGTVAHAILSKPRQYPDISVAFPTEEEVKAMTSARKKEAAKYVDNPGEDWGPGARASSAKAAAVAAGKSVSVTQKPPKGGAKAKGKGAEPVASDSSVIAPPPSKRPRSEE